MPGDSWYKIVFSPADIAAGKHVTMREAFEAAFFAAGSPRGARLFQRAPARSLEFYFSPGAVAIAPSVVAAFAGSECLEPDGRSLRLVVGRA